MSNAPETWELIIVPEGQQKLYMSKDTKIRNAATFRILKEDHTLANMLRMRLLDNPRVLFAGYKVPHPLEHEFLLKIQTTDETSPLEEFKLEISNLIRDLNALMKNFKNELTLRGLDSAIS